MSATKNESAQESSYCSFVQINLAQETPVGKRSVSDGLRRSAMGWATGLDGWRRESPGIDGALAEASSIPVATNRYQSKPVENRQYSHHVRLALSLLRAFRG